MKSILLLIALVGMGLNSYAQRNEADSLAYQSHWRQYIVHLPPGFEANTATPVVMVLHGGSGNYRSVQGFTRMNRVSNQNGFLTVYPQGRGIAPPGYSWADGRGTTADDADIDDVGFLSRLIDTLYRDYLIDTNRIYVCGFSNGGFMTQKLACALPGRFAAVGALGCSIDTSLIKTCTPGQAVPTAYFSGTADPEVPYEGGAMRNPRVTPIVPVDTAVQFWVRNNNCQTNPGVIKIPDSVPTDRSTVDLFQYTHCDCEADVYFYRINNGGHTWPGVPVPQFPQLGNTNEDIDASEALWNFFRPFSRCDTAVGMTVMEQTGPFEVFPNPVHHWLKVHWGPSTEAPQTIGIYSMDGRRRYQVVPGTHAPNGTMRIPTGNLPSGPFILRLNTRKGIRHVQMMKE